MASRSQTPGYRLFLIRGQRHRYHTEVVHAQAASIPTGRWLHPCGWVVYSLPRLNLIEIQAYLLKRLLPRPYRFSTLKRASKIQRWEPRLERHRVIQGSRMVTRRARFVMATKRNRGKRCRLEFERLNRGLVCGHIPVPDGCIDVRALWI